ncbi:MAG: EF-P lysine aminoacylase GenX [Gammaproteobacteria bacterium]|nr:EF-P lysine aminoacylase GenX [Gammaproteobacteria bacterium]
MQDWQPGASQAVRQLRAQLYKQIRDFFAARKVLEVDTPILSLAASTDPMLDHWQSKQYYVLPLKGGQNRASGYNDTQHDYYLQTSPEFAMKRLLASGSGSIYQICRCFRAGESGRRHNPEFVMLEWYRVDFQLIQLIEEVVDLLQLWWPQRQVQLYDYRELLLDRTGLDYEQASVADIQAYLSASATQYSTELLQGQRDDLYDLVFSNEIEPSLGIDSIAVLTNYPVSQAQYSQLNLDGSSAQRFEVYLNGVELANGYQELRDGAEQAQRFAQHNAQREVLLKPQIKIDHRLLAALDHGLPACSGVALGIDRLLMLVARKGHIDEIVEFALDRS